MTPVVAFFNSRGRVGTTTLVYNTSWMLRRQGINVLTVDLDPQADLTSAFLDDRLIEELWLDGDHRTVFGAVAPLFGGAGDAGEVADPYVREVEPGLGLVPGDLSLAGIEEPLATAWHQADHGDARALQMLAALDSVVQQAAAAVQADIALLDLGPNLTAVSRAALVAADHVVVPLATDLGSFQSLASLGPVLRTWRQGWVDRRVRADGPGLPEGRMQPAGYIVLQRPVRVDRAVGDYDRWLKGLPAGYHRSVLGEAGTGAPPAAEDPRCLGVMKHYHGIGPMAHDARRPIFLLRSADGAVGAHQQAVQNAYGHFADLARRILDAVGLGELVRG